MTAISKNVYFDVLDDFVNKYNNTVHRTIKMKLIDKLVIMSEHQNTKTFFLRGILQICQKEFLLLEGVFVPWTYVISVLNCEPFTGNFCEKELQKTSQEKFRIEKIK